MTTKDFENIVKKIRDKYPERIFPEPTAGCAVGRYTAAGCRLACDLILMEVKNERKKSYKRNI